jgi:hypothetical protein
MHLPGVWVPDINTAGPTPLGQAALLVLKCIADGCQPSTSTHLNRPSLSF